MRLADGSADGSPPGQVLVGRGSEVQRLAEFVGRAGQRGGSLFIVGDPGVGKSALLSVASGMALMRGTQVLSAAGLEHEADLTFSLLNLLLNPLRPQLPLLEPLQRNALAVALGFGEGVSPGRLVLVDAVLALLRVASAGSPVLLVVDDLPWMDRSSATILGLLARRLDGTRIGFLAAARTGETGFFERAGLPEMLLGPLDATSSSLLMDRMFPALPARTRQHVLTQAQGNPLALIELPAAVEATIAGAHLLPTLLPLGHRLRAAFAGRLDQLPRATRSMLLLAALDDRGDLQTLLRTSPEPDGLAVLAPAEVADIIRIDDQAGRVVFRHSLVRAAVVASSTSAERRHCHRLLAAQLHDEPDRRAWHLASAHVQPDQAVSALLERTATNVLARGDAVGAVAALIRAADLSPDADRRSRLLAQAAFVGAGVTGDMRSVPDLLVRARRAGAAQNDSLQAAVAASYALLNADGDLLTAHRLLVSAIEPAIDGRSAPGTQAAPADPALLDALHTLLSVCSWAELPELWPPLFDAMGTLRDALPRSLHLRLQVLGDPVRLTQDTLSEFDRAIDSLQDNANPAEILQIAIAAAYIDRLGQCRAPLLRVIQDGRTGGAVTSAISAMMALCIEDFAAGRWDEAQQFATEGLALCDEYGYGLPAWLLRHGRALVAAGRGDQEVVDAVTGQMLEWAVPRKVGAVRMFARHARGLAALGRGHFEEAYQQLSAVSPPGVLPPYTAQVLKVSFDLVEAAIRTNRHLEARAHVAVMEEAGLPAISGHLALTTTAAAAMCASGDRAVELFEAALATPGADQWPFDRARVELAFGEQLRRSHAPAAARPHLEAALATFVELGARPWVLRGSSELRATGQGRQLNDPGAVAALTPQEREIASLAASGLTNKQIGERLYLSPRTVATHLYRVFPKLAITSRAALRDALANAAQ